MNLRHLAPDIEEDILFLPPTAKGKDPVTLRGLRRILAEAASLAENQPCGGLIMIAKISRKRWPPRGYCLSAGAACSAPFLAFVCSDSTGKSAQCKTPSSFTSGRTSVVTAMPWGNTIPACFAWPMENWILSPDRFQVPESSR